MMRFSTREEEGGLGWKFAEPFSAEPAAEDIRQEERPTLVYGPLLRDGVESLQGVADVQDAALDVLFVFVL